MDEEERRINAQLEREKMRAVEVEDEEDEQREMRMKCLTHMEFEESVLHCAYSLPGQRVESNQKAFIVY